jgi:hypothetical protein
MGAMGATLSNSLTQPSLFLNLQLALIDSTRIQLLEGEVGVKLKAVWLFGGLVSGVREAPPPLRVEDFKNLLDFLEDSSAQEKGVVGEPAISGLYGNFLEVQYVVGAAGFGFVDEHEILVALAAAEVVEDGCTVLQEQLIDILFGDGVVGEFALQLVDDLRGVLGPVFEFVVEDLLEVLEHCAKEGCFAILLLLVLVAVVPRPQENHQPPDILVLEHLCQQIRTRTSTLDRLRPKYRVFEDPRETVGSQQIILALRTPRLPAAAHQSGELMGVWDILDSSQKVFIVSLCLIFHLIILYVLSSLIGIIL